MNYCGIDVASQARAVCVMNEHGALMQEQMVGTEEADRRRALSGWGRLRCIIEAAPLAEWLAQFLEAQGHEVVVIDPRRAKAVIQTKNKTDTLDARN